jgi:hypothetical protein
MALEQRLREEIADLYVRAIIAEHALEAEKLAKEKLQHALDKIQHEQSLRAMENYHERRQSALDYYKRKYEEENGVKPDECDCGRQHCVHLGDDEID